MPWSWSHGGWLSSCPLQTVCSFWWHHVHFLNNIHCPWASIGCSHCPTKLRLKPIVMSMIPKMMRTKKSIANVVCSESFLNSNCSFPSFFYSCLQKLTHCAVLNIARLLKLRWNLHCILHVTFSAVPFSLHQNQHFSTNLQLCCLINVVLCPCVQRFDGCSDLSFGK